MSNNPLTRFQDYLKSSPPKEYIVSVFAVGSSVNGNMGVLSDLDLVVIGRDDTISPHLLEFREYLRSFFSEELGCLPILFAEPSFERTYYLDHPPPSVPLVHIIFHPLYRFMSYLRKNDPIVISWSKSYCLLYGQDLLGGIESREARDSSNLVDSLEDRIQTGQNACIVAVLPEHHLFFAKTLIYVAKRLTHVLNTESHYAYASKMSSIRESYLQILRAVAPQLNDQEWIQEQLLHIEQDLLWLRRRATKD